MHVLYAADGVRKFSPRYFTLVTSGKLLEKNMYIGAGVKIHHA